MLSWELYNQLNPIGVNIPNGFAVTAAGYRFSKKNNLEKSLDNILNLLDTKHYTNLSEVGQKARVILSPIPYEIRAEIQTAYQSLSKQSDTKKLGVAVRSSTRQKIYLQQVLPDKCSLSLILVVKSIT
jgi:pyruvate,water dikinase